ncbi:HEAT repeat domain-containing protein [Treponema phagedenis]|nr:HEAT repeat domain-containing protein [Treponema phagedenis]QEK02017.1 HEAT repeat domain-containing protein [Treponema phagedenis]QEK07132.1 HEAT repeat domain-containing protein [Treponema phagedenis]QSH95603.1 HEAT repeat domain-containing protein [Treponema phagedenis]QSH98847.1 HEAT repeat domain-containing protein [Treponema phagedenis]
MYMKKIFCVFCMVFFTLFFVAAEEKTAGSKSNSVQTDTADTTDTELDLESEDAAEASAEEQIEEDPETKKQLDTIRYGLEGEVLTLIEELKKNEDTTLNAALQELFAKTKSTAVRDALFDLFSAQKNDSIKDFALEVLKDPVEYKPSTVRNSIKYLVAIEEKEAAPLVRELMKDNSEYADDCISAFGKIGSADDALFLIDYFKNELDDDQKTTLIKRQNLMVALEQLHLPETAAFLEEVARDSGENAVIRGSAAIGLAQIGDDATVSILSDLYEDSDPILRIAAVKGLGFFTTTEAEEILLQGFKDSYYKVRMQSLEAAAEKKPIAAFPYILHRAKTDPVDAVKYAAIKSVGAYNTEEGNLWLKETFLDKSKSNTLRVKAAEALMNNNLDFFYADLEQIMIEVAEDETKKKLRYELGKIFAKVQTELGDSIALAYLTSKDAQTIALGLDMFKQNRYAQSAVRVSEIAEDSNFGSLQRRAKTILADFEQQETPAEEKTEALPEPEDEASPDSDTDSQ